MPGLPRKERSDVWNSLRTNPCRDHAMIPSQNRFFSLLSSQESPFAYLPGSFAPLGNAPMTIRRFRNEKGATFADRAFRI
jgi:hypothetical protein